MARTDDRSEKDGGAAAAFTRGPWLMASHASSVVGWPIVAPQAEGRVICSLNYADPKAFGGRGPGDGAFNKESRANGCLIAEAPALVEALAGFVKQWEACGPNSNFGRYFEPVYQSARAALAKALGEQPK